MRYQSTECSVNNGGMMRAPEAHMPSLLAKFPVSAKRTAEWEAHSAKYVQQRFAEQNARQTAKINADRQNLIAAAQRPDGQSAGQYEAGMRRAQASSNARQASDQAFSNHLADQNEYRDPATGNTYKVSNQYSHTYLDSTGRTILQTNSAYAPGPDTVWQELQPHN